MTHKELAKLMWKASRDPDRRTIAFLAIATEFEHAKNDREAIDQAITSLTRITKGLD